MPSALLAHAAFQEGYEQGYLEGNPEEEVWTFPKLLNEVYATLNELGDSADLDMSPYWALGFLLGELAGIAGQDRTLALTGLAHYCFLLPLFTQERPADWPRFESYHAYFVHRRAMKAYRARIRAYKAQGKSYDEAQRLALAGTV